MLSSNNAVATIAVKDIKAADKFYGDKLGFPKTEKSDDEAGVATYESGDGELFVYQSKFAGGYGATVATWPVCHIEDLVRELKGKGIDFEHYDMPDTKLIDDVHIANDGAMKVAWFKDPDGNILCLVEG